MVERRIGLEPGPDLDEEFLGIDICTLGGYSFLSSGLRYKETGIATNVDSIFLLIHKYFQPKLNEHLLFDKGEYGELFLNVITEIQSLSPGVIEEDTFRMYYLFKVNQG